MVALAHVRPAVAVVWPLITEGAQGEHVVTILELLNQRLGAGLTVDGVFGPATQTAVRTFQARYTISVDGIVGVMTWNALVVHKG